MSGRMQDVDLVEVDGPGQDAATPPREPAAGWLRGHWRVVLPTVLAAAVALLVAQLVLDARERAHLSALAQVDGVLAPVGDGLEVRWRGDAGTADTLQGADVVGGMLVGVAHLTPGDVEVRGLDPRTGAVRWRTPLVLPAPVTSPRPGQRDAWTTCQDADGVAVCVAQQAGTLTMTPDVGLWVVDPSDGHVLREQRLPGGSGLALAGGRVLTATAGEPEGSRVRWTVTAREAATGAPAWSWTTDPVDVVGREDGVATTASATGAASLDVRGDRALLLVDGKAWELGADGRLLRSVPLDGASWAEVSRSGGVVVSTYDAQGPRGEMLLDDGRRVRLPGVPLFLSVDDGSAPGVVLVAERAEGGISAVSARDGRTGDRLWRVPTLASTALLLDGRLVLGGPDGLRALDARTGHEQWRTPLPFSIDELATDGRSVVVRGLGVSALGYALDDGRRLWQTDLLPAVADPPTWSGEALVFGWRVPYLYTTRPDGSVAVLG